VVGCGATGYQPSNDTQTFDQKALLKFLSSKVFCSLVNLIMNLGIRKHNKAIMSGTRNAWLALLRH
jgi:hypothetical protein